MNADSSSECLVTLVKQLGIPVTKRGIFEELGKHPDHPSLLAISDVLHTWGATNNAYKVSVEQLRDIPAPFIAHTLIKGADFLLIKKIDGKKITCNHGLKRKYEFYLSDFKKIFTGNILVIDNKRAIGELDYSLNKRKELIENLRHPIITGICALLIIIIFVNLSYRVNTDWRIINLFVAKSLGLALTVLLLIQSVGASNSLLQRLCDGKKTSNCNSILQSKEAKLTEEVSWAEVGFLYFVGSWLALITLSNSANILYLLALISMLCLPFTAYSLYYQARVARQWCILCSAVQALLWIEFLLLSSYLTSSFALPSFADMATLIGCMLTPFAGWLFIKPYIQQAQQTTELQQQLQVFKQNRQLFNKTLAEQPCHELLPNTQAIHFGNPKAKNIITVVSNPSCSPCAQTHQLLEHWLTRRDDFQVQILFAVPSNPHDQRAQVASHLMSLNIHNQQLVRAALHNWYIDKPKEYKAWARLYPVEHGLDGGNECLQKQFDWCQKIAVVSTPTVLLNGRKLPKPYLLKDIQYFL
ncbi:vitamin K epoxide reductase family protein [Hymenobacter koreensis]|uniref:vitamin K epoxide reductase family protein n=1 Tax=Hymenobacter koreensis TaxID=1084523 RepID=UPI0031EFA01F